MTKTEAEQIATLQADMCWVKEALTRLEDGQKEMGNNLHSLSIRVVGIAGPVALLTSLVVVLVSGHLSF
jgi:hypothetical protein